MEYYMAEDDRMELQREWRQIVLHKLDSLEKGQKVVEDKLVSFVMTTTRSDDFEILTNRVRNLEETKVKALAAWAVIQGLSVAAAWLVSVMLQK
jgi:hypothetical protein